MSMDEGADLAENSQVLRESATAIRERQSTITLSDTAADALAGWLDDIASGVHGIYHRENALRFARELASAGRVHPT